MNKLAKIGVSALCGSLASVASAYAGAIEVTGSANATWIQKNNEVTGNPLGQTTALTFTGSGELDNGATFSAVMSLGDKAAWSDSTLSLTQAGLGTLQLNGSGLDRLDDEMPNALATAGDTTASGLITALGAGEAGVDLEWTIDEGMLPEGLKAYVAWTPRGNGASVPADKSSTTADSSYAQGYDVVIDYDGISEGLRVFAGIGHLDGMDNQVDRDEWVLGGTYAVGSFTVGYQHSDLDYGTASNSYENDAYGISFAVNDDLSISYGHHESDKGGGGQTQESDSIQLSYTMGGATIAISESETDNRTYTAGSNQEATLLSVTLAF